MLKIYKSPYVINFLKIKLYNNLKKKNPLPSIKNIFLIPQFTMAHITQLPYSKTEVYFLYKIINLLNYTLINDLFFYFYFPKKYKKIEYFLNKNLKKKKYNYIFICNKNTIPLKINKLAVFNIPIIGILNQFSNCNQLTYLIKINQFNNLKEYYIINLLTNYYLTFLKKKKKFFTNNYINVTLKNKIKYFLI